MEWMLMPLRRYADFSGRSRRKEYWMFALLNLIIYVVLYSIMLAAMAPSISDAAMQAQAGMDPIEPSAGMMAGIGIVGMILLVYALAVFIPSLAVTIRRFHDQDKSGWFILLGLIPLSAASSCLCSCAWKEPGATTDMGQIQKWLTISEKLLASF